jgi:hypothetical protein
MGSLVSAVAGPILNTVGGLIGGSKASQAANQQATAFRDAATWGRNQAAFQPFGITTGFGSSNFGIDPTTGRVTSAGYTLDPRLAGIQGNIYSNMAGYNPAEVGAAAQPLYGGASSLFNIGQGYLAQSPAQAEADYISRTQAALAPSRETELANARNQLFQTGRGGLATGGTTTGMMQANPELAAIYNARALQDLNITQQAQEQARKNVAFGGDLYSSGAGLLGRVPALTSAGYDPLRTQLGLFSDIEKLGMQPYEMSTALGKTISDAGARQGEILMGGERAAAPLSQAYSSYSPWAQTFQGAGQALSGMSGSGGGSTSNWFDNLLTANRYNTNVGSQQTRMLAEQDRGLF